MFITFEGLDGSGKTTQITRLKARLEARGKSVLTTREPGGTPMAEQIRGLLLREWKEELFGETEMLLYAGARSQHVRQVIRPALEQGIIVISDRYIDSSLVYQGIGRELGVEKVRRVNEEAIDGLWPDRTYLLDVTLEQARIRMQGRDDQGDHMDRAEEDFRMRIREGYLALQAAEPERIRRIDARQGVREMDADIWLDLADWLQGEKA